MDIIQTDSSFYFQKPSSQLEQTYSLSAYEPGGKQKLAETQSTQATEVPELSQWLNDPGFKSLWDSQTATYKQFLKDFEAGAAEFTKAVATRWPDQLSESNWYKIYYTAQNDWESFKTNFLNITVLNESNFKTNFTNFFKANPQLLTSIGLTPEQAAQLVAAQAALEAQNFIKQTPSPSAPPKPISESLTAPSVSSNWNNLPEKSSPPVSLLTAKEKEVGELTDKIDFGWTEIYNGMSADQKDEKKQQILEWQQQRFNLINSGLYAAVDSKLPNLPEAKRGPYLKPEESTFTDPNQHTNRWDVALGIDYDKPGVWTSTGVYALNANHNGLTISSPTEFSDEPLLQTANHESNNLTMGAAEGIIKETVTATGALSSDVNMTTENGGSISYYIVQGSPYNTAYYDQATPQVQFGTGSAIQSLMIDQKNYSWADLQSMSNLPAGSTFTIELNNGAKWKMYAGSPLVFQLKKSGNAIDGLVGEAPLTGLLRLAHVPSNPDYEKAETNQDEQLLDQYSPVIMRKATASTSQSGYDFAYESINLQEHAVADAPLVLLKYPAQQALTQGPIITNLTYETTSGPLRAVVGSYLHFQIKTPSLEIIPIEPRFTTEQLNTLKSELLTQMDKIVTTQEIPKDSLYTAGKVLQQQATTLEYALKVLKESNMSDQDIQQTTKPLADKIKSEMNTFLNTMMQWDSTWGSIVPASSSIERTVVSDDTPDSEMNATNIRLSIAQTFASSAQVGEKVIDPHNEFGAGFFNDKALQWGYIVTTAGILAKYDRQFGGSPWVNQKLTNGSTVKDMINTICRDIINPSAQDPDFPQNRTFDFYTGHNIASGQTHYADGRNQESSSEAYNCFLGMSIWANATNQPELRDHALTLAGIEAESAQIYYQIGDPSKSIYLPKFAENTIGVGNYFDQKMDAHTFFGSEKGWDPSLSIGIQSIPAHFNSMNELHNPAFAKRAGDYLIANWSEIPTPWKSITLSLIAETNPALAEQLLSQISDREIDEGTNRFILQSNLFLQSPK